jgi:molybdate-binding protein/DNA-binding HxlR family transcriptional regulator
MIEIEQIKDFDQIKIISDPHRLAILRLLMASPATLTQLGRVMGEHPAWIRHHLKQLEAAGLVEMKTAQVSGGFVEKYYRAKARAFYLQEMILPETSGKEIVVVLGSHDLALNALAQRSMENTGLQLIIQPVGSLDGLVALRQGIAQMSGCHLLDLQSGEYNLPFIRHIFPDRPVVLVTLAHREQGLLVTQGNPLRIRGLEDLAREDVTLVNRNRGSGTRLWLDKQLEQIGISPERVRGYNQEVRTHTAVATAVQHGRADAGLGLYAAARLARLEFIPLFQERYDLALPEEEYQATSTQSLLDYLQSRQFRGIVDSLGGYDTHHTGEELHP